MKQWLSLSFALAMIYLPFSVLSQERPQRYSSPGPVRIINFNNEHVAGVWRFAEGRMYFRNDGIFEKTTDRGEKLAGQWWLGENRIEFSNNPPYQVYFFDGHTMTYKLNAQSNTFTAKKMSVDTFTWHDLIGQWKDENSILVFRRDQTFRVSYNDSRNYIAGKWGLNDRTKEILSNILEENGRRIPIRRWSPIKVISFTGNAIRFQQDNQIYIANRLVD